MLEASVNYHQCWRPASQTRYACEWLLQSQAFRQGPSMPLLILPFYPHYFVTFTEIFCQFCFMLFFQVFDIWVLCTLAGRDRLLTGDSVPLRSRICPSQSAPERLLTHNALHSYASSVLHHTQRLWIINHCHLLF